MNSPKPSASSRAFSIPEILSQIVGHTLFKPDFKDLDDASFNNVMAKVKPTWPVLLVCKHWRDVVLSTPALWSNIVLCHNDEDDLEDAVLMSTLDTYLERSRNAPLTISMDVELGRFLTLRDGQVAACRDSNGFFRGLLERLLPTQHRWQDVKLRFRWWDSGLNNPDDNVEPLSKDVMTLRLPDMTALATLSLEFLFYPSSRDPRIAIDVELGPCRSLEHLEVLSEREVAFCESTHAVSCVEHYFPNLRSLTIAGIQIDWNVLLRQASSIEHLQVHWFPDTTTFGTKASESPIEFPNLKTFGLAFVNIPHMLQRFKLPPLVKLKAMFHGDYLAREDELLQKVMVAITKSGAELDDLFIDWSMLMRRGIFVNPGAFQEFFRVCDKLRRLCLSVLLYDNDGDDDRLDVDHSLPTFFSALKAELDSSTNQTQFLPRLNTFEVKIAVKSTTRPENVELYRTSIRSLVSVIRRKYNNFLLKFTILLIESSDTYFEDWNRWRHIIEGDLYEENLSLAEDDDFRYEAVIELDSSEDRWFMKSLDLGRNWD